MSTPLLQLRAVSRVFALENQVLTVLDQVDLSIYAGEFVAIIGRSGSGKSSLLNILGCLDRPSSGEFRVAAQDTAGLNSDELASLRSRTFGFIFQRYNLLPHLSALDNVILPAIYAGQSKTARTARAQALLSGLGLGGRLSHTPNKLSGGEQQRVSVARALVNLSPIILADEPTGALDRKTSGELMAELCALNRAGSTVIVVTHDAEIASYATRVIEISDGRIQADRAQPGRADASPASAERGVLQTAPANRVSTLAKANKPTGNLWALLAESLLAALASVRVHRLRTALSVLGITIGITAIVTIAAVGAGFSRYTQQTWAKQSAQRIEIYSGGNWSEKRALAPKPLTEDDLRALMALAYVDSATPSVRMNFSVRLRNVAQELQVDAASEQFARVNDHALIAGINLSRQHIRQHAQVALINRNTRLKFFQALPDSAVLGQILLVGNTPVRVIGVCENKKGDDSLQVSVPYTTAASRLVGRRTFDGITLRLKDSVDSKTAEKGIIQLLSLRHGKKDFHAYNLSSAFEEMTKVLNGLTVMMTLFGAIALLVGGIGVMNIMLVSVTERTREIGIRMAVGARQANIMQQFLIEAVFVCLIGACFGLGLTVLISAVFPYFVPDWGMVISPTVILIAVACATATGVLSGLWPARNAAKLDPVVALARD
jgi:macrolide transport system ATP-binding/permease protein